MPSREEEGRGGRGKALVQRDEGKGLRSLDPFPLFFWPPCPKFLCQRGGGGWSFLVSLFVRKSRWGGDGYFDFCFSYQAPEEERGAMNSERARSEGGKTKTKTRKEKKVDDAREQRTTASLSSCGHVGFCLLTSVPRFCLPSDALSCAWPVFANDLSAPLLPLL